jgi:hypothetical protein
MIQTLKMQCIVGYTLYRKPFSLIDSESLTVAGLNLSKEEVVTLKNSVRACFGISCVDAILKLTLF